MPLCNITQAYKVTLVVHSKHHRLKNKGMENKIIGKELTPEEYYQETFESNYSDIAMIKDVRLFSFNTMIQFAELYHKAELVNKIKYTKKEQRC